MTDHLVSTPNKTSSGSTQEKSVVNNFSITIGTRNGSGSATSNLTLMRAIFRMGIPISGKNLFPSNIQGQPTWFTIRLSKDGYLGRCDEHEIIIAMNADSFQQDVEMLSPGGVLFYDQDITIPIARKDITTYEMPIKNILKSSEIPPHLRNYAANMVYVGIVAQILGINQDDIYKSIEFHFKGKKPAIDLNYGIIQSAAQWASNNLEKKDTYSIEPMDLTKGYILAEGNTAAALGSLYGGVQFVSWYPITPASTLAEDLNYFLPMLRNDPLTGKKTCVVIQSEDELAAIGMCIGAGWAGLRAMTSTSGPGVSLMAEFAGLAYFTETPLVIWNVQRVGPSTGMPTRTAQGDITSTQFLGHGDTDCIQLFPCDPHECFEFGWQSFDYAERFQTPVFILSDLDLGMQHWMTKPFEYPNKPMDRGKLLWEKDLEKRGGAWGRYLDEDGDGIPYRTVPGNHHPNSGYMARGTSHNEYAKYTESNTNWEKVASRIKKKFETARETLPTPIIDTIGNQTPIGIISYGSTWPAVQEARDLLSTEDNIQTDYMRIRAIPFSHKVREFLRSHERVYVAELNRDGQMRQLLTLEYPDQAIKLISLCHVDGLPMTARWLREHFLIKEAKN